MLKKIFKKGGIILVLENENIQLGYYMINNYIQNKTLQEYKKEYYITQSFIY